MSPTPTTVITGASRGLGRSMALHLADRGIAVIGTYRTGAEEAAQVMREVEARGSTAAFVPFDADADAPESLTEKVLEAAASLAGRDTVDALVNNAGSGVHAPFTDITSADVDRMLHQHVRVPFLLTQSLLPHISDGGRILFVSSGLARFTLPGYSAYAMAKGAVEVLTRYLALELGDRGIRVNCLAPGAIETDFGGGAVRDIPEVNAMVAEQIPLGRAGQPDDIGAAAAALLGDDLGWMNGTRVEVSGGQRV